MRSTRRALPVLVLLAVAGCATAPSVDVTKRPDAPLNLTRMGIYVETEWRARPSGDTSSAIAAMPRVRHFAAALAGTIPEALPPLLAGHGVTVADRPEPQDPVFAMRVGDVRRNCHDRSECVSSLQVLGSLVIESTERWSFESWLQPAYLDMEKFSAFERDIVEQMAADGVIPRAIAR